MLSDDCLQFRAKDLLKQGLDLSEICPDKILVKSWLNFPLRLSRGRGNTLVMIYDGHAITDIVYFGCDSNGQGP